MEEIAVVGTGAIGSCVGADLTEAGYRVDLIDQWPEHVDAMKSNGLEITMPGRIQRVRVRSHHLCELASMRKQYDLVLLATKSYDNPWMVRLVEPYLKTGAALIGLQNGINEDTSSTILGPHRVIGCVVELGAEIFTPGLVRRNMAPSKTWFALGELDGVLTERAREVQSILRSCANVELSGNILAAKWTKLIVNAMSMGPFGLFGLPSSEARRLPGVQAVCLEIGREAMAVASALGYPLQPVFGLGQKDLDGPQDTVLETMTGKMFRDSGDRARTAPIHDHIKGRRNEIAFINGAVSRQGAELNIPTPYNDAVTEIASKIDSGELQMSPSNLALLSRAGFSERARVTSMSEKED